MEHVTTLNMERVTGNQCQVVSGVFWSQTGCQTSAVHRCDAEIQSVSTTSSSTQTEPEPLTQLDPGAPEPPGLRDFLLRVEEELIGELVTNARSHAFDGFQVNWGDRSQLVSSTDQSGGRDLSSRQIDLNTVLPCLQVSCLHLLQHPVAQERGLHVTCVSWSCTGSVVACGFGR